MARAGVLYLQLVRCCCEFLVPSPQQQRGNPGRGTSTFCKHELRFVRYALSFSAACLSGVLSGRTVGRGTREGGSNTRVIRVTEHGRVSGVTAHLPCRSRIAAYVCGSRSNRLGNRRTRNANTIVITPNIKANAPITTTIASAPAAGLATSTMPKMIEITPLMIRVHS